MVKGKSLGGGGERERGGVKNGTFCGGGLQCNLHYNESAEKILMS